MDRVPGRVEELFMTVFAFVPLGAPWAYAASEKADDNADDNKERVKIQKSFLYMVYQVFMLYELSG